MHRRTFITALAGAAGAAALAASPARAAGVADQLVDQLRGQGYSDISVSRTLLGRVRILATSDRYRREIVVNPRTGEILRDYWELLVAGEDGERPLVDPDDKGGSGKDSDDDDDEDDDDDDNSGHGGSGSGGSGGGDDKDDD